MTLTVLVGLGWNAKIDVFAAGCLLAELQTGRPLFIPSSSVVERLLGLERVLERVPTSLAGRARRRLPHLFNIREGTSSIVVARKNVCEMVRQHRAMRQPPLAVCYPTRTQLHTE